LLTSSVYWSSYSSQGLSGENYHCVEVSESSSNLNQGLQNENSATTSDVKSVVPKFSNINLLDNDLVCGFLVLFIPLQVLLLKINGGK